MIRKLVSVARRVGAHPRLEPGVALALRARTVHGTAGFVLRELIGSRSIRPYQLRESDFSAVVRHGTPDVVTLGEIFYSPYYALPEPVARVLGPSDRQLSVLDLGANIGLFGLWLLSRRPSARIEAFEPDPGNFDVLSRTIALNALEERMRAVRAAASNADGELRFRSGEFACSRIDEAGDVSVPAVDVLSRIAAADLVKMDIEGGEWAILGDPRFIGSSPRCLVLEYHPEGAPAGVAPRAAVEERLRECSYEIQSIFHEPHGVGMLWAWR